MSEHSGCDDFPQHVKDELARRDEHQCSMPTCRAPASGPSDTRASGASNVGVAHIISASRGGPRDNEQLSSQERPALDNGIWLCQPPARHLPGRWPTDNRAENVRPMWWSILGRDTLVHGQINTASGLTHLLWPPPKRR
jgi:hypothetical protein